MPIALYTGLLFASSKALLYDMHVMLVLPATEGAFTFPLNLASSS